MFGRIDDLREKAERRVADLHRRGVTRERISTATKPPTRIPQLHSFYLLVDRPSVYGLPDDPSNPWMNMPGDYIRAIAAGLAALIVFAVSLLFSGN